MSTDKCPHCGVIVHPYFTGEFLCGTRKGSKEQSWGCEREMLRQREEAARQKAEEEAKGLREELAAIYGHPNPDDVTSLGAELGAEQARNLQLSDELAKAREEVGEWRRIAHELSKYATHNHWCFGGDGMRCQCGMCDVVTEHFRMEERTKCEPKEGTAP